MSSWSREQLDMRHRTVKVGGAILLATSGVGATSATAAEVYYQPMVTLSAETNSNIDLDRGKQPQVQGYLADVSTNIGIDTPDSTTTIRPRAVYRYYPKDPGDDRLEGYLDFISSYRTQRSITSIAGTVLHVDEFNAEFTTATFNDVNPNQPPADTGRTVVGATRDSAVLSPKFVYSLSPTFGAGASGQYQIVNYSPSDNTSHRNFDYYQARAFLNWAASQRSEWTLGGLGSKFETRNVFSQATGSGAFLGLNSNWTPLLTSNVELFYQRTRVDTDIPTPSRAEVDRLGGSFDLSYKTGLDRFHFIARRSVAPSGGGGVYTTNRVQFQYDRAFTARFSMTGAVVGIRTHGLTPNLAGDDRKYAQTLIEAHWFLTSRLFLQSGYQYVWQKYQNDPESAANNRIYLQIGYQGLGQQR